MSVLHPALPAILPASKYRKNLCGHRSFTSSPTPRHYLPPTHHPGACRCGCACPGAPAAHRLGFLASRGGPPRLGCCRGRGKGLLRCPPDAHRWVGGGVQVRARCAAPQTPQTCVILLLLPLQRNPMTPCAQSLHPLTPTTPTPCVLFLLQRSLCAQSLHPLIPRNPHPLCSYYCREALQRRAPNPSTLSSPTW